MSLKTQALKKLNELKQNHLLKYWDQLHQKEQKSLYDQIIAIDPKLLKLQQSFIPPHSPKHQIFEAYQKYSQNGNPKNLALGKRSLEEGSVACMIVAGGQGSRLGFNGPKGMYPVSVKYGKTLYQIFAERTLAASKNYKQTLPLAIMTSQVTHHETKKYFSENHFFGLSKHQVDLFCQKSEHFLNEQGQLFLNSPSSIASGPNGNGDCLHLLYQAGIYDKWKSQGIKTVNFIQVDNPLADPFDAELIGFQQSTQSDVIVKCIERLDPHEKVGVIVQKQNKPCVIEYSELSRQEQNARQKDNRLKHLCANISLFNFSMDFIQTVASNPGFCGPYHLAHKAVDYLADDGQIATAQQVNAWKFERFIFDLLPFAKSVKALIYPREECFAPLKNQDPPDNITTVKQALQARDKKIYEHIYREKRTGHEPFELDPQNYYR